MATQVAKVRAPLEKVAGEGVPEHMRRYLRRRDSGACRECFQIAGEGLTALLRALWKFLYLNKVLGDIPKVFTDPSYLLGLAALAVMALYLILASL